MTKNPKTVLALYGNVSMPRVFCSDCGRYSMVVRGRLRCCDTILTKPIKPRKYQRVAAPENVRRLPPYEERMLILSNQDDRCFYCNSLFGSEGYRHAVPVEVKIEWDHQVPYAYSQDNRTFNFVAACQVCNGLKASMVFQTVDEAKAYLALRRKEKGYDW